jgi:hypothetical protein
MWAVTIRHPSAFAKGFNLVDAVEILRNSEAHGVRRSPEHAGKGLDVIVHQSGVVWWSAWSSASVSGSLTRMPKKVSLPAVPAGFESVPADQEKF